MNETDWEFSESRRQSAMENCAVLTPYDIMSTLNIGRNSAYRLLASGELKAFRIGRSWRISAEELEKYVFQNRYVKKYCTLTNLLIQLFFFIYALNYECPRPGVEEHRVGAFLYCFTYDFISMERDIVMAYTIQQMAHPPYVPPRIETY